MGAAQRTRQGSSEAQRQAHGPALLLCRRRCRRLGLALAAATAPLAGWLGGRWLLDIVCITHTNKGHNSVGDHHQYTARLQCELSPQWVSQLAHPRRRRRQIRRCGAAPSQAEAGPPARGSQREHPAQRRATPAASQRWQTASPAALVHAAEVRCRQRRHTRR